MKDKSKLRPKKVEAIRGGKRYTTTVWVREDTGQTSMFNSQAGKGNKPTAIKILSKKGVTVSEIKAFIKRRHYNYGEDSKSIIEELDRYVVGGEPKDTESARILLRYIGDYLNLPEYSTAYIDANNVVDKLKGNIPDELFRDREVNLRIVKNEKDGSSYWEPQSGKIMLDRMDERVFAHEFMHYYIDVNNYHTLPVKKTNEVNKPSFLRLGSENEEPSDLISPPLQAIWNIAAAELQAMKKGGRPYDNNYKSDMYLLAEAFVTFKKDEVVKRMSKLKIPYDNNGYPKEAQMLEFMDMIKGININIGAGHPRGYMKRFGKTEFFADLSTGHFHGNKYMTKYFPETMKAFGKWINSEVSRKKIEEKLLKQKKKEIIGERWASLM